MSVTRRSPGCGGGRRMKPSGRTSRCSIARCASFVWRPYTRCRSTTPLSSKRRTTSECVQHDGGMTMWDFQIGRAFGAMVKTAPFIVFRMLVYFGIGLLYVLATGTGGAIGYGVTAFGDAKGSGAPLGA